MKKLMRMLVVVALAALAVPVVASAAPTSSRGIVVQRDTRAGAIVLASPSGGLTRVSLAKPQSVAMGAIVRVLGSKVSVLGHSHHARVRGTVVRRGRHSFALAGNGSVLAVSSATPPPAGQQIATTVQVTPTALSDDDGQVEVEDSQVPSAELRGTVLSQSAITLQLAVNGFPAGLAVSVGTVNVPSLTPGTSVEAHVTLAPDPAHPGGIVLTLVSLHVENDHLNGDNGGGVKAEGRVTAITEAGPTGGAAGSITIAGEHGTVTFVIPAGFGATGAIVGDRVEARGTAATTAGGPPTLVRLEGSNRGSSDDHGNSSDDHGGSSGGGDDGGNGGDN
jgi:hypothetical protein